MRASWDETWMAVAHAIAKRSKCVRSQTGCALVSSTNRILAAGYNGPPRNYLAAPGDGGCDLWCPRAMKRDEDTGLSYDDCVSIHAEANALIHADRSLLEGGTAYVTRAPCFTCAKNLANSGVARVVYYVAPEDKDRAPERTAELLQRSQVAITLLDAYDGTIR